MATDGNVKEQRAAQRQRILIVEDNADTAWIMGRLLTALASVVVEIADDGPTALTKLPDFRPHIVLLDIGLPRMNGYAVARRIRELPEFEDVLLVALTGYGQEKDRHECTEAGFDVHLLKPAGADQLQELLRHPKALRSIGESSNGDGQPVRPA